MIHHQASQMLQTNLLGNGNGKVVHEEMEMKRQLWLKSCRAGEDSSRKTYGSAFVAPSPNPKTLLHRSSSKLFGTASEDTQNLLDDMI